MMPFGSKFIYDFKRVTIRKITPNISIESETMEDKNHQRARKT